MTEPTNIADAITAAQGRVADCYTAISNKGGTLPQTQNLANMPTAIGSIPSGSDKVALTVVIWAIHENPMNYSRFYGFYVNNVNYLSSFEQHSPSYHGSPLGGGSLYTAVLEFDRDTVANWRIDGSSKITYIQSPSSGTITLNEPKLLIIMANTAD